MINFVKILRDFITCCEAESESAKKSITMFERAICEIQISERFLMASEDASDF